MTRSARYSWIIAVMGMAALPIAAFSQTTSVIRGIVVDSLHNEPLSGAEVTIGGDPNDVTSVLTDSAGRFSWSTSRMGSFHLTVHHSVLDSLGIILQSSVTAGGLPTTTVILGVPSFATIKRMYCGDQSDGSFIIGRVMRGTKSNPAEKAKVMLDWYSITADSKRGVVSEYSSRQAQATAWGHYAFCGLPPEFEASLSASTDSSTTPRISFTASNTFTLVPWLFLPDAGYPPATISGHVSSALGPLADATVEVLGLPLQVRTDEKGAFHLPVIVTGTTLIRARKIGYTAEVIPVNVTADAEESLQITLDKPTASLQTIVVRAAMNRVAARSGFDQRAKRGFGSYIDAAEILRTKTTCVVDFIRRRTGLIRRGPGCSAVSASDIGTKYGFGFRGIETLRNRMPDPPKGEADAPKPSYQSTQLGVKIVVDGFTETSAFKTGEIDLGWLDAKDVVGIEVYTDTRGGVSVWIWTTAYNGINRGLIRPAQ